MENKKVVLVGAGNLATSLGTALKNTEISPIAVWSRTMESAKTLADKIDCDYYSDLSMLPSADIVIISVVDSALYDIASTVVALYPDALILHTAGSISIDILKEAGCRRYGVLYPMQTFSKLRVVDFSTVSIFVEGCNKETEQEIFYYANILNSKVFVATSEQRRMLHLAAVFACNFSNAMYAISARLLEENGLPFEAMLPLIDETAAKVHNLHPTKAQTGPAVRGDDCIQNVQRSMLDDELGEIYNLISEYIKRHKSIE